MPLTKIFRFLFFAALIFTMSFSAIKTASTSAPVFMQSGEKWANDQLQSLSLEEKIGQFFMVATWSEKDEAHQLEIEQLVKEQKIGGLIYFQGNRANLTTSIQRMQQASKVPLLIGMDAEWGVSMRLANENRFPYAYTIGTANDTSLTRKMGEMMGQECKELGIHINFAPDADVNTNPNNPVIGFRSFGEEPKLVAEQVGAFVKGMESLHVMTSIKHFPGHGDTDKDSHSELPTVHHPAKKIIATDFPPFIAGIKAGTSSVMVGHLNVPSLDKSGTPSSLSKKIIQNYLIDSLQFKGLVISDALNMKAVADHYGKTEVVVKAFEAGCDILLYPENVKDAINALVKKVNEGKISMAEINRRCLKILKAKQHAIIEKAATSKYTKGEIEYAKKQVYEKALTLVKNQQHTLPILTQEKIAVVNIGGNATTFNAMVDNFAEVKHYYFSSGDEALQHVQKLANFEYIVTSIHPSTVRSANNYGMPKNWDVFIDSLPQSAKKVLVHFGNPTGLNAKNVLNQSSAILFAYENHPYAQDRAAQAIFGAIPVNGKLQFSFTEQFNKEKTVTFKATNRLKYTQPEELGIDPNKLSEIDTIVQRGIRKGAFPGCQVFVSVEGKVIYSKSFGTKTYGQSDTVLLSDVYDIASVSKIVGSTTALMYLQSQDKVSLSAPLKNYIPEVTGQGEYGQIVLRDMMAHQAGLKSWIPFYKKTVKNGQLDSTLYSQTKKANFELKVADGIYLRNDYADSIYQQILATPLNPLKKYEYSDLGYYFVKKIVEKQSGESFDQFLYRHIYRPLGLQTMYFNPLNHLANERIVPTENDKDFRKQVVRGTVHDPGAAMLGGVGGHAGIFSNANDLGIMMQLFLNKGSYAGKRYIDEKVVAQYTKTQNPGNRRGAGFDRPTANGVKGPCSPLASQQSFGHSGFTGTFAWADPQDQINYVFLSNRVYPSAENWKIRDLNIRSEIQRVIYEAVKTKK